MDERNFVNETETETVNTNETEVVDNNSFGNGSFDNSAFSQPTLNNDSGAGKGMAIASMVCGIASIVIICCTSFGWLGILGAIAGIILGFMHKKSYGKNGMATAGIVCSIIALAVYVVCLIIVAIAGAALGAAGIYDIMGSYY